MVAPSGGQACDQTREKGVLATADGGKTLRPLWLLPGRWDGSFDRWQPSWVMGDHLCILLFESMADSDFSMSPPPLLEW